MATAEAKGYRDPRWLTYRQAQALGGHVRKGESATQIVFWKVYEREAEDEEPERLMVACIYSVFNVDQTQGCRLPVLPEAEPHSADPAGQSDQGFVRRYS